MFISPTWWGNKHNRITQNTVFVVVVSPSQQEIGLNDPSLVRCLWFCADPLCRWGGTQKYPFFFHCNIFTGYRRKLPVIKRPAHFLSVAFHFSGCKKCKNIIKASKQFKDNVGSLWFCRPFCPVQLYPNVSAQLKITY